jgi:putative transposase
MPSPNYLWRQLSPTQKNELLTWRKSRGKPWHSPPHPPHPGSHRFHITAACFEHQPHIGHTPARMDAFACDLLAVLEAHAQHTFAWCVLPNHYHVLVESSDLLGLMRELGRLHGRTSHAWNGEENARGRRVFFRAADRAMRSDAHFWATLNYVHHNPVHHAYVERWTNWPWSSAGEYLAQTGQEEAQRIWRAYPLDKYGEGWDESDI